MKKFRTIACFMLALLTIFSMFAIGANAAELPEEVTLTITKYALTDEADTTPLIGLTGGLTGTEADKPASGETLEGVTFTVYKVGTLTTAAKDVNTENLTGGIEITTNEDGVATLTVSKDDFGLYYVKETAAPAEVTATSAPFFVYLPKTNAEGTDFLTNVCVYPKNYITLGSSILQKIDSSANEVLTGAKFAVYNTNGTAVTTDDTQVIKDYFGNAIGDSTNHYLTTDENGYVFVNNLPVGEYYFIEKVAPQGYIVKSDMYKFSVVAGKPTAVSVNADGTLAYDAQMLLTADNSLKPKVNKFVTVEDNKDDSTAFDENVKWIIVAEVPSDMGERYTTYKLTDTMDSALSLKADSFAVYTSKDGKNYTEFTGDYEVSTTVKDASFEVSFTDTADLAGVKTVKVEYNTTLIESETVMGEHIFNNVRLDYATDVVSDSDIEENPPYVWTGGYKFKKIDPDRNALEGAKFDVIAEDGKTIATLTSGEDGTFEITGLKKGKYFLQETEAPEGFELISGKIEFTVTETSYSQNATMVITNYPTHVLPITGGMGTLFYTVMGLGLITLSVVFFAVSKKSGKKN